MANRRMFTGYDQGDMMQPSSPMTPSGNAPSMEMASMTPGMEHPETMRRRITPMVGDVEARPTMLQELLAMMNGGQ